MKHISVSVLFQLRGHLYSRKPKQVRRNYRSGTGGTLLHRRRQTLRVHSPSRWQHFFCVKLRHVRQIDSVAPSRKSDSDNRCVFT